MAWGYSPRSVVKARKASLDTRRRRSPAFLLVLVGASASLLVFGIVTQVLAPSEPQEQEDMMIRVDEGAPEGPELLISPEREYEKGEDTLNRKYRIRWKKPAAAAPQPQRSTWEQDQERMRREREPKEEGPWDQSTN